MFFKEFVWETKVPAKAKLHDNDIAVFAVNVSGRRVNIRRDAPYIYEVRGGPLSSFPECRQVCRG